MHKFAPISAIYSFCVKFAILCGKMLQSGFGSAFLRTAILAETVADW